MDIEKLYETVILRDILEYFTPGAIVVFSTGLLFESALRAIGAPTSLFQTIFQSFTSIIITSVICYAVGHVLTGIDYVVFRGKETTQAIEVLSKNKILYNNTLNTIADYMGIPAYEINDLLNEPQSATTIREISRGLIHARQQSLYRDFVSRHSIFSRFCQNMALALTFFLLATGISSLIAWPILAPFFLISPIVSISSMVILFLLTLFAIRIFSDRAVRLRKIMIKHTFQILYIDSIDTKLGKQRNKDQENK